MPCETPEEDTGKHRIKSPETTFGVPACVARPVGKTEIAGQPKAKEAAVKEWKRLWEKDVWDAKIAREWHDVAAEARKNNVNVHMGRLFGIMVEKAAELPEGDPRRNTNIAWCSKGTKRLLKTGKQPSSKITIDLRDITNTFFLPDTKHISNKNISLYSVL